MNSFSSSISLVEVGVLSSLFDYAADVAFFVKDEQGRYVVVNDSLCERHGLKDKSQAIGKKCSDIITGDFGLMPSRQDEKVISTGTPIIEYLEMHWLRPHQPVWCLTTKLPLTDSGNNVVGLIGFSRDVSVPMRPEEVPADFAVALNKFKNNLAEKVTPGTLAEQSNLKPYQLTKLTKRIYGLTPSQLITKLRITAASQLLRDSSLSILQVANQCGYFDHSAFARAFKATTGFTPSYFRK